MASTLKNIFNSLRVSAGFTPLFIQTSECVGKVTYEGVLAKKFRLNHGRTPLVKMRMIAEATSCLSPEKNPWKVSVEIGSFGRQPVSDNMSYQEMMSFMKAQEANAARQAGLPGNDADVAAKRMPGQPRSNFSA